MANTLPAVLGPVDDALCALLGWDAQARVSLDDLRTKHGMPNPPEWEF